jgi:PIN domain nuclease of toxin-antitoxin system
MIRPTQSLLLDTHAVIWIAENTNIAQPAIDAIAAAHEAGAILYVSPISAWEVGMLTARNRIKLLTTPERWFRHVLDTPGVRLAQMPPELLIASSYLPGQPPKDPTDRIIAATARDLGATLITRDRLLLDYGRQGHISVVAC